MPDQLFLHDLQEFPAHYPTRPARLKFSVASPLLSRARLAALAPALPADQVEFNTGDLAVSVAPDAVPVSALQAPEIIAQIGECRSWLVLKKIERDPDYAALVAKGVDALSAEIRRKTGRIFRREGFVFISSPGATTPFHLDPEHNVLMQIEGEKVVTVFSPDDRDLADQQALERFHAGGHRNLPLAPEHAARGVPFALGPGDALYIPPFAPHWVKVTSMAPSLSLSLTWRSRATMRAAYLHQINHRLRARGANPHFPGEAAMIDTLKIWRESARRRAAALFSAK